MRILWLSAAEDDLVALTDYIADNNPKTALEIFYTIRRCVEKLASFPYAGREGRVKRTRELVIPYLPYIIVYTVVSEVRILAIFHTSRKWPAYFKGRLRYPKGF